MSRHSRSEMAIVGAGLARAAKRTHFGGVECAFCRTHRFRWAENLPSKQGRANRWRILPNEAVILDTGLALLRNEPIWRVECPFCRTNPIRLWLTSLPNKHAERTGGAVCGNGLQMLVRAVPSRLRNEPSFAADVVFCGGAANLPNELARRVRGCIFQTNC